MEPFCFVFVLFIGWEKAIVLDVFILMQVYVGLGAGLAAHFSHIGGKRFPLGIRFSPDLLVGRQLPVRLIEGRRVRRRVIGCEAESDMEAIARIVNVSVVEVV